MGIIVQRIYLATYIIVMIDSAMKFTICSTEHRWNGFLILESDPVLFMNDVWLRAVLYSWSLLRLHYDACNLCRFLRENKKKGMTLTKRLIKDIGYIKSLLTRFGVVVLWVSYSNAYGEVKRIVLNARYHLNY